MICITLGTNEKPAWWLKFMDYTFHTDNHSLLALDRKEWWKAVDASLQEFGGRLQRNWAHNYFFITFRLESNYTLFVLKFT